MSPVSPQLLFKRLVASVLKKLNLFSLPPLFIKQILPLLRDDYDNILAFSLSGGFVETGE